MVGTCYVLDVKTETFSDAKGVEHMYCSVKLLERLAAGNLGDLVQLTGPAGLEFEGMADYQVVFKLSMRENKPRVQVVELLKVGGTVDEIVPF